MFVLSWVIEFLCYFLSGFGERVISLVWDFSFV